MVEQGGRPFLMHGGDHLHEQKKNGSLRVKKPMRSASHHELADLFNVAKAQLGKNSGSRFFVGAIAAVEERCVSVPCMQDAFERVDRCKTWELKVRVRCVWHAVGQKDADAWWLLEQLERREVSASGLEKVLVLDVSPELVEVGVGHDFVVHLLDDLAAGDEPHCCVGAPAITLWSDAEQLLGVVGLVQLVLADVRPAKLRWWCSHAIGHRPTLTGGFFLGCAGHRHVPSSAPCAIAFSPWPRPLR